MSDDRLISPAMVTITKETYDRLVDESLTLDALYAAGVDTWEGFDYAIRMLEMDEEE